MPVDIKSKSFVSTSEEGDVGSVRESVDAIELIQSMPAAWHSERHRVDVSAQLGGTRSAESQGAAMWTLRAGEGPTEVRSPPIGGFHRAARDISRHLTKSIAQERENSLYARRAELLAKKLRGELTSPAEVAELDGIEWQVNLIDSARMAEPIDTLKVFVDAIKNIAQDVETVAKKARKRGRIVNVRGFRNR
jgi:hypothetical protein